MLPRLNWRSWALPLAALLFGCAPKIGNRCTLSTDCSQIGDRLCDATQPDGYCTIFNCEPDTCPESVCVRFNAQLDPACEATDLIRSPRLERTFCMQPCDDESDCRTDYTCIKPSERGARVVDILPAPEARSAQKVCMVALSPPQNNQSVDSSPNVCGPGDVGPAWTPYIPAGGASGASSSGMGGASSSSSSGVGGAGGNGGMGADGGPP